MIQRIGPLSHLSEAAKNNLNQAPAMRLIVVLALIGLSMGALRGQEDGNQAGTKAQANPAKSGSSQEAENKVEIATFGNGCFWCTEAVFQRIKGVHKVVSGYMGGHVVNPTYEQVCTKKTGHAEVLHLEFDPEVVSYEKLLEIFWKTHDPTTPNRQGDDVGPQYRSAIFYHNDHQKELAEQYKEKLDKAKAFPRKIVTEITQAGPFYPAEDYHQNYYNLNKDRNPYCRTIQIKLHKFREVFPDEIDSDKDKVK